MDILQRANEFENRKHSFKTTSDRILAAREAKEIILGVNEIYKQKKDAKIMEIMKRLNVIKRKHLSKPTEEHSNQIMC